MVELPNPIKTNSPIRIITSDDRMYVYDPDTNSMSLDNQRLITYSDAAKWFGKKKKIEGYRSMMIPEAIVPDVKSLLGHSPK